MLRYNHREQLIRRAIENISPKGTLTEIVDYCLENGFTTKTRKQIIDEILTELTDYYIQSVSICPHAMRNSNILMEFKERKSPGTKSQRQIINEIEAEMDIPWKTIYTILNPS